MSEQSAAKMSLLSPEAKQHVRSLRTFFNSKPKNFLINALMHQLVKNELLEKQLEEINKSEEKLNEITEVPSSTSTNDIV